MASRNSLSRPQSPAAAAAAPDLVRHDDPRLAGGGGTTAAVQTYVGDVPSGSTSPVITHGLGTLDVAVYVRTSGGVWAPTATRVVDANAIELTFTTAPTAGQYRVHIVGLVGSNPSLAAEGAWYQDPAAPQSVAHNTNTRVRFDVLDGAGTSDLTLTTDGGGTVFTIGRAGVWEFGTTVRFVGGTNSERNLMLGPTSGITTPATRWAGAVVGSPGTAPCAPHISVRRRMAAGATVCAWVWHANGAALALDAANSCRFDAAWIRP